MTIQEQQAANRLINDNLEKGALQFNRGASHWEIPDYSNDEAACWRAAKMLRHDRSDDVLFEARILHNGTFEVWISTPTTNKTFTGAELAETMFEALHCEALTLQQEKG